MAGIAASRCRDEGYLAPIMRTAGASWSSGQNLVRAVTRGQSLDWDEDSFGLDAGGRVLTNLSRRAYELDIWLHENIGRPYILIQGWGLALSILESLRVLFHTLAASADGLGGMIKLLVVLAFQAGLLINQLAQWHTRRIGRSRPKPD